MNTEIWPLRYRQVIVQLCGVSSSRSDPVVREYPGCAEAHRPRQTPADPARCHCHSACPQSARFAEQPLNRIGTKPLVSFTDAASSQQMIRSQSLNADVQTPCYFMDRLVAKQRHAEYQPEHLVGRYPPHGHLWTIHRDQRTHQLRWECRILA